MRTVGGNVPACVLKCPRLIVRLRDPTVVLPRRYSALYRGTGLVRLACCMNSNFRDISLLQKPRPILSLGALAVAILHAVFLNTLTPLQRLLDRAASCSHHQVREQRRPSTPALQLQLQNSTRWDAPLPATPGKLTGLLRAACIVRRVLFAGAISSHKGIAVHARERGIETARCLTTRVVALIDRRIEEKDGARSCGRVHHGSAPQPVWPPSVVSLRWSLSQLSSAPRPGRTP